MAPRFWIAALRQRLDVSARPGHFLNVEFLYGVVFLAVLGTSGLLDSLGAGEAQPARQDYV